MSLMEQLAVSIVFTVVGLATFLVKWANDLRKIAERKAEAEAMKRMEMEIRHDVEGKSIDDVVAESNKRHGRE